MGITIATPLLPVKVKTERPTKMLPENGPMLSSGTMEDLRKGYSTLLGDQGDHVQILSGSKQHSFSDLARTIQESLQEFTYGANSWIGTNSVVMANVGRDCVIGTGSVVTRTIPDNSLAVGNPARVIHEVYPSQKDASPSPPALKCHSGTIPDR